jgi:hypothetical protein
VASEPLRDRVESLMRHEEGLTAEGLPYWMSVLREEEAEVEMEIYEGAYAATWGSETEFDDLLSVVEPWWRIDGKLAVHSSDRGTREKDLARKYSYIQAHNLSDFDWISFDAGSFNVEWYRKGDIMEDKPYVSGKEIKVQVPEYPDGTQGPYLEPFRMIYPVTLGESVSMESAMQLVQDSRDLFAEFRDNL